MEVLKANEGTRSRQRNRNQILLAEEHETESVRRCPPVRSGDDPAAILFLLFLFITFVCSRPGILSTSIHKSSRGPWGPGFVIWILFCPPPPTAGSRKTRPFFSIYIISSFATLWIIQWRAWLTRVGGFL